ncbi:hypothetical protein FRB95_004962 [Tulasnella sp. JGI-2019a]|nr:hypothetical protein FRB95_004962 [Tulasnella sp. JGI-2019a]
MDDEYRLTTRLQALGQGFMNGRGLCDTNRLDHFVEFHIKQEGFCERWEDLAVVRERIEKFETAKTDKDGKKAKRTRSKNDNGDEISAGKKVPKTSRGQDAALHPSGPPNSSTDSHAPVPILQSATASASRDIDCGNPNPSVPDHHTVVLKSVPYSTTIASKSTTCRASQRDGLTSKRTKAISATLRDWQN